MNAHLWQDSVNGVPALREHQLPVEHQVKWEGLTERIGADPSLLRAVLLVAVEVFVERLLFRVLLLYQKLDVIALLTFRLDHLRRVKLNN